MEVYQLIELIIVLLFVGFFAGAIIAFKHINKFTMEIKRKKGLSSGRVLSQYKQESTRYVASSILGYLLCMVLLSILLDKVLSPYWNNIPFGSFNSIYLKILSLSLITIILIFPFTLIARSHFRAKANKLLTIFSFLITFWNKIFYPIAKFLTGISHWMLEYLFNLKLNSKEIPFDIAKEGTIIYNADNHTHLLKELNTSFFENALNLPYLKIRQCLTPRKEIAGLKEGFTREELKEKFLTSKHSKVIIYKENIDDIAGYVHHLDLFSNKLTKIEKLIRPISVVPETMNIIALLTQMTKQQQSIVWVVDEYGGTAGIITLEDLLEEIFGDIGTEKEEDELINLQIAEKEFLFSGRIELDLLSEKYGFLFEESDSETLSGYIIAIYESIPKENEVIVLRNFEFKILNVTDTRIALVKMRVLR